MKIDLKLGDCLEVLKTIPDNSVDSVVTDPPYGLGFMNKEWDSPEKLRQLTQREADRSAERKAEGKSPTDAPFSKSVPPGLAIKGAKEGKWFQEWCELWAAECLRILKPGGHILSFSAPRTYHRMATAFEDAGFEIRDQLMWVFGSGFPKSHNIKKQIEKEYLCQFIENAKNAENKSKLISVELIEEKTGSVLGNVVIIQEEGNENKMVIGGEVGSSQMDTSIFVSTEDIEQNTTSLLKNRLEEILKDGNKSITSTELKMIIDLKIWNLFQYQNTLKSIETQNHTALKPAHEPIVMARKPLSEKSIAENVLKHGTGGINIDGSRIEMKDKENINFDRPRVREKKDWVYDLGITWEDPNIKEYNEEGRWPANIIFDEEAGQLLDEQSGISKSTKTKSPLLDITGGSYNNHKGNTNKITERGHNDKGGASRFFYCPKAAKKDRNEGLDDFEKKKTVHMATKNGSSNVASKGMERFDTDPKANHHPTVKPTDLMRYLINLITPPNGTILDPFMGSGSTGKAAVRCGLNFIGIEKEQEYMNIAKARIEHERNKPIQQSLFDGKIKE